MNRPFCLLFVVVLALTGQVRPPQTPSENTEPNIRLPNGLSQREEMLKADHKKSMEDAADLVRHAEEFKADLEKNDRHVLSVGALKKLDEIEKLTKRLRGRLKRY